MTWPSGLLGLAAGLLIAMVTTPVGVSGAVFLLPVQLSVLDVPSPAVTPTNLLFNVVAAPGALLRYRRQGTLSGPLTRQLVAGTMPGDIAGAIIRSTPSPGRGCSNSSSPRSCSRWAPGWPPGPCFRRALRPRSRPRPTACPPAGRSPRSP